jgi:DNA-binding HxlR family transcriptional regulator
MPKHPSAGLDAFELQSSKWTLPVLLSLHGRLMRHGALRKSLGNVSNKSLGAALRQLERDGLVGRRVFAQIPPRVDYWLTPLGDELVEVIAPLKHFVAQQQLAICSARRAYDGRRKMPSLEGCE